MGTYFKFLLLNKICFFVEQQFYGLFNVLFNDNFTVFNLTVDLTDLIIAYCKKQCYNKNKRSKLAFDKNAYLRKEHCYGNTTGYDNIAEIKDSDRCCQV